jgi:HK97 gp10 family phage protein
MKVEGAKELAADFEKLAKTEAAKILRKETRAGTKTISNEIKSIQPTQTGTIKKKIKIRAIKRNRKYFGHEVAIQQEDGKWYAPFSELGHKTKSGKQVKGTGAMREGFDNTAPQVADKIIDNVANAIEKALKK